ncbi:kinase-like protein [Rozella allomycis CSF55]|uniref:non-specific serine/threonine protein kinase n=1 Tax=Rozella allomycis (strain CSF55) TaxID=988480 RepID=A0A4P9YHS9_ROZAC|nr:kinase-like protein [Rozella allomycis CSF55]
MEDGRKPYGRRKIKIEFIEDKSRRHITFSKRKAGIMKKAYELSTLTGTQVLLLVASETGHVYTFATPKLSSIITEPAGKNLIKQCLNADDDPFETESSSSGNGTSRKSKKKYPQKSNDDDDEEENKDNAEEHTNEKENTHINNNASYSNYSHGEAMDGMGNSVNSYYIQNPNMAYNPYISHYWPYAQAAHMNQQFSVKDFNKIKKFGKLCCSTPIRIFPETYFLLMATSTKSSSRTTRSKGEDSNPDYALPGIGNYMFVKTVGEGNFAKVAIKIIDKTQLDEKKLSKLYREVRIMKMLHHPHVVRLYEVIETKSTVFLVMEYSTGGELYDYLVVHGRMKEKEARAKFRQILSALSYCHKKHIIHRDLKFCGSPPYAAPELFQGRRYVGPEVDIWSLGVILYVLTTGCLPFDGKNLQEMRESVCRGKYRIPFYLSENCEKLLKKLLVKDSSKRAGLEIIIDDPWVNEGYEGSPIDSDLAMRIDEDEEIIKLMETKFHIERDTIIRALRENLYDDSAAIYHLLYHEKDKRGEHGDIKKLDSSPKRNLEASLDNKISVTSAMTPAKPTSPTNPMSRIDENEVLLIDDKVIRGEQSSTAANGSNSSTRRRRFTVSGHNEPSIEKNNNDEINTRKSIPAEPKDAKTAFDDQDKESANTGVDDNKDDKKSSRKRNNTIVGIFRSASARKENPNATTSGSIITTDQPGEPRSLRFTFNSNTTSSKAPDDIISEVLNGCSALNITTKLISRYLVEGSFASDTVKFEIEVCKLPRLKNLHGLRFKRISGTSEEYKELCEKLLSKIAL